MRHDMHRVRAGRRAAWAATLVLGCFAPAYAQGSPDPAKPPEVEFTTAEALKAKMDAGQPVTVIDVRSSSNATQEPRIKGALRIKLRRLQSRIAHPPLRNLPRDQELVTYCSCSEDSAGIRAAEILQQAGFKRVRILKGGWDAWRAAGGAIELKPTS